MSEKIKLHALVSGTVQGVGFRYFAYRRATELGLKGFVRNLPDGRVEAVAEGEKGKVEQYRDSLAGGPRSAVVEKLDATIGQYSGEYDEFEITY